MAGRGNGRVSIKPHSVAAMRNAIAGIPPSTAVAPTMPPTANDDKRQRLYIAIPTPSLPGIVPLNAWNDGVSSDPAPTPVMTSAGYVIHQGPTLEDAASARTPIAHSVAPALNHRPYAM